MLIKYVTDQMEGEPDILAALRHQPLLLRGLDGSTLHVQQAPAHGWTHEGLCAVQPESAVIGCDAFLGTSWVGSTEV
ncbi:hypothetical protein YH64_016390 [Achromobacter sp. LC458]|jgi:hypothetical protein|uniref:Uncharacterized protein n=1 Tax=Achromobacter spanius TaxID=217203 RepID=A0AA42LV84_9BURK|nr:MULTISPECIES: hypothetical protein [Achromobacter]MDH0740277.1 hypothetical protein [Achromobacter spanius]TRM51892.1 hypothetical protein YH64_016390 [Achromobacter sp. LC458]